MTFRKVRVAVFVDGCYWHGCPVHFVEPKANAAFWKDKIGKNRYRDAETNGELEKHGWIVLRFWEHEDPESCAGTIEQVVRQATANTEKSSGATPDR
jgi:DNA mismatch endonuclease (patch repair protein)